MLVFNIIWRFFAWLSGLVCGLVVGFVVGLNVA